MKYNLKISLPFYKICYSFLFVVLLPLVRGISSTNEIGGAMDANIALLAILFCADTYQQEYQGNRWEIFALYSPKVKFRLLLQRLAVQYCYLTLLIMAGYWFFYWQKPVTMTGDSQLLLYGTALFAISVSIFFWGSLSVALVNLFHNLWAGIAISFVLWLTVNSTTGQKLPDFLNVFAYGFSGSIGSDSGWVWGKAAAAIAAAGLILFNKKLLVQKGIR